MPASRRSLHATAALTETPPDSLPRNWSIARIVKGVGNNVYAVRYPSNTTQVYFDDQTNSSIPDQGQTQNQSQLHEQGTTTDLALVELSSRFRNKIWLRNGGFVVVDRGAFSGRDNKLEGEIVNVVREERVWMKKSYWPEEFKKKQVEEESEDETSNVGKMPSSPEDSEEECDA